MTSPLLVRKGTAQGRIRPVGWAPPAGDYAMVLGCDTPGIKARFVDGDRVRVSTGGLFADYSSMPFRALLRGPAEMPAGTRWEFQWLVDGDPRGVREVLPGYTQPITGSPIDISQIEESLTLTLDLTFRADDANVYEVEMPGVYIDAFGAVENGTEGPVLVTNAYPDPGQTDTPRNGPFLLSLSDVRVPGSSTGLDMGSIVLSLDGVGSLAPIISVPRAYQYDIAWYPPTTLDSDTEYTLRFSCATLDGILFSGNYGFRTRDETAPAVVGAEAVALRVVRVAFSEAMRRVDPSGIADALNPALYAVEPLAAPAHTPTAVSVAALDGNAVEVTFSAELSPGIPYLIAVGSAEDLAGNALEPPTNSAEFVAVYPEQPEGRSFALFDWYPALNKREDLEGTGDLARFTACLQEILVLLLSDIDRWADLVDPDLAPEWALDLMLRDLGNPFDFDLEVRDKRRLVQLLVPLYRQKGTNPGIVNALRFFLSLEATVETYTASGFELGEAELDGDDPLAWELGPGTTASTYSFDVRVGVILSATQRKQARAIVDYMKPAWTHFVTLYEPDIPEVIDHVELGLSDLGTDFLLH